MSAAELTSRVAGEVAARAGALTDVADAIWAHPELGFEEHFAHDLLTRTLEGAGLEVERGAYGLDTAFRADVGESGPLVVICCEYDALPGIGHACGHNLIAAAGLGAGLAAGRVAAAAGGRVRILGTPAEEGGGGKALLLDAGAFDDAEVAMMVHPADADLDSLQTLAIHQLEVTYHGEAAHAAAAPHRGRNALDAAVLGYLGVSTLRQHIEGHERVHGVFTDGGDKPNIVPARAAMHWYVRSATRASLARLEPRVVAALEGGALATGCSMEHHWSVPYDDLVDVGPLMAAYAGHSTRLGRPLAPRSSRPAFMGSTDMGNVSHAVPSIHPMLKVAPDGVAIHTPAFADHARGEAAHRAVVDGAVAMAQTAVEVWTDSDLRERVRAAFAASVGDGSR